MWWLKDQTPNNVVPGIGIEISGGGLMFLLEHRIAQTECSIAFSLSDRRMRANLEIIRIVGAAFKEQAWQQHSAKFVGLMEKDYNFIITYTDKHSPTPIRSSPIQSSLPRPAAKRKSSISHESYDLLPLRIQEQIVQKLVDMRRLQPPSDPRLAHLVAHYGGVSQAEDGNVFHRFLIRTQMNSRAGPLVYNTEVLISDDGATLSIRN
jgi:hypothetical protein